MCGKTARELINRIQNIRKDNGFDVTDKVDVLIHATGDALQEITSSLEEYKDFIASQTLALSIGLSQVDEGSEVEWNEGFIRIKVTRK